MESVDSLIDKALGNAHYFYLSLFKHGYIVCDPVAIVDYIAVSTLVVKHCDDVLTEYEKNGVVIVGGKKQLTVDEIMYIEKTKKRIEEFIKEVVKENSEQGIGSLFRTGIRCKQTDIGKDVFTLIDMLGITFEEVNTALINVNSMLTLSAIISTVMSIPIFKDVLMKLTGSSVG